MSRRRRGSGTSLGLPNEVVQWAKHQVFIELFERDLLPASTDDNAERALQAMCQQLQSALNASPARFWAIAEHSTAWSKLLDSFARLGQSTPPSRRPLSLRLARLVLATHVRLTSDVDSAVGQKYWPTGQEGKEELSSTALNRQLRVILPTTRLLELCAQFTGGLAASRWELRQALSAWSANAPYARMSKQTSAVPSDLSSATQWVLRAALARPGYWEDVHETLATMRRAAGELVLRVMRTVEKTSRQWRRSVVQQDSSLPLPWGAVFTARELSGCLAVCLDLVWTWRSLVETVPESSWLVVLSASLPIMTLLYELVCPVLGRVAADKPSSVPTTSNKDQSHTLTDGHEGHTSSENDAPFRSIVWIRQQILSTFHSVFTHCAYNIICPTGGAAACTCRGDQDACAECPACRSAVSPSSIVHTMLASLCEHGDKDRNIQPSQTHTLDGQLPPSCGSPFRSFHPLVEASPQGRVVRVHAVVSRWALSRIWHEWDHLGSYTTRFLHGEKVTASPPSFPSDRPSCAHYAENALALLPKGRYAHRVDPEFLWKADFSRDNTPGCQALLGERAFVNARLKQTGQSPLPDTTAIADCGALLYDYDRLFSLSKRVHEWVSNADGKTAVPSYSKDPKDKDLRLYNVGRVCPWCAVDEEKCPHQSKTTVSAQSFAPTCIGLALLRIAPIPRHIVVFLAQHCGDKGAVALLTSTRTRIARAFNPQATLAEESKGEEPAVEKSTSTSASEEKPAKSHDKKAPAGGRSIGSQLLGMSEQERAMLKDRASRVQDSESEEEKEKSARTGKGKRSSGKPVRSTPAVATDSTFTDELLQDLSDSSDSMPDYLSEVFGRQNSLGRQSSSRGRAGRARGVAHARRGRGRQTRSGVQGALAHRQRTYEDDRDDAYDDQSFLVDSSLVERGAVSVARSGGGGRGGRGGRRNERNDSNNETKSNRNNSRNNNNNNKNSNKDEEEGNAHERTASSQPSESNRQQSERNRNRARNRRNRQRKKLSHQKRGV